MAERFAVWLDREVVAARGPEAGPFLQGQLSQDVLALGDGASAWSWLLSPQGKVDALVRVTRLSVDDWLLDTDGGWAESMVARLNRFKLRTKVAFETLPWRVLGLRGDDPPSPDHGVAIDVAWPGVRGVDVAGDHVDEPDGWPGLGGAEYESWRIRAGIPKMGAELTERTIPAETGLVGRTVSFTKGCYTGQELVARIDSRGSNVPRRLHRLSAAGPLEGGAELVDASGKPAGTVTSAAPGPDGYVALGYLRRGAAGPVRAGEVDVTAGGPVE